MIALRDVLAQFSPLPQTLWDSLTPQLATEAVARGDHWLQPGQAASHMAVVQQGAFRQYYITADGTEYTVYFSLEGSLVCAYSQYLQGQPCGFYLQALEPVKLQSLPLAVLFQQEALYPEVPQLARKLAEYVFINLESRLHGLLMLSPEDRYLRLLTHPPTCLLEGAPPVWERIPQKYLASFLGITPVSLSRIRARVARRH